MLAESVVHGGSARLAEIAVLAVGRHADDDDLPQWSARK